MLDILKEKLFKLLLIVCSIIFYAPYALPALDATHSSVASSLTASSGSSLTAEQIGKFTGRFKALVCEYGREKSELIRLLARSETNKAPYTLCQIILEAYKHNIFDLPIPADFFDDVHINVYDTPSTLLVWLQEEWEGLANRYRGSDIQICNFMNKPANSTEAVKEFCDDNEIFDPKARLMFVQFLRDANAINVLEKPTLWQRRGNICADTLAQTFEQDLEPYTVKKTKGLLQCFTPASITTSLTQERERASAIATTAVVLPDTANAILSPTRHGTPVIGDYDPHNAATIIDDLNDDEEGDAGSNALSLQRRLSFATPRVAQVDAFVGSPAHQQFITDRQSPGVFGALARAALEGSGRQSVPVQASPARQDETGPSTPVRRNSASSATSLAPGSQLRNSRSISVTPHRGDASPTTRQFTGYSASASPEQRVAISQSLSPAPAPQSRLATNSADSDTGESSYYSSDEDADKTTMTPGEGSSHSQDQLENGNTNNRNQANGQTGGSGAPQAASNSPGEDTSSNIKLYGGLAAAGGAALLIAYKAGAFDWLRYEVLGWHKQDVSLAEKKFVAQNVIQLQQKMHSAPADSTEHKHYQEKIAALLRPFSQKDIDDILFFTLHSPTYVVASAA